VAQVKPAVWQSLHGEKRKAKGKPEAGGGESKAGIPPNIS